DRARARRAHPAARSPRRATRAAAPPTPGPVHGYRRSGERRRRATASARSARRARAGARGRVSRSEKLQPIDELAAGDPPELADAALVERLERIALQHAVL